MELVKAYVSRYGALANRTFSFKPGINPFLEGNGQGKSTLASFLRAMLYGLSTTRKKAKDFEDRSHYCPYGANEFGGSLEVKEEGHLYRIERTFDRKSSTKDQCEVHMDGRYFDPGEKEIGKILLGVDEETFLRTAYLSGNELGLEAGEGVISSLTKQLHGDQGFQSYDSAIAKLNGLSSAIRGKRKNPNDALTKLEAGISALKEERLEAHAEAERISSVLEELEAIKMEKASIDKAIAEANAEANKAKAWADYKAYIASGEAQKKEIAKIAETYKDGLPKKEDLALIKKDLEEIVALDAKAKEASLNAEEEEQAKRLADLFKDEMPNEKVIGDAQEAAEREIAFKRFLDPQGNYLPKYQGLIAKFANKELKDTDIEALKAYAVAVEGKEPSPEPVLTEQPKKGHGSLVALLLTVLGGLVFAAGIILLFLVGVVLGGSLTAAGAILAFISLAFYFRIKGREAMKDVPRDSNQMPPSIASLYYAYGLRAGETPRPLIEEYREYLTFREEEAVHLKDREYFDSFFSKYQIPEGSDSARLNALDRLIETHKALLKKQEQKKAVDLEISKKRKPLDEAVSSFTKKHGIEEGLLPNWLSQAETDLANINLHENEAKRALAQAEAIKKESKLEGEPPAGDSGIDINALSARQSELSGQAAELLSRRRRCEEAAEKALAIDGKLKKLGEEREALLKQKELYDGAKNFLAAAHDALVSKYLEPLSASFGKYAGPLKQAIGYEIRFFVDAGDSPLKITVSNDYYGDIDWRHLSLGELSLVCLCFRLALSEQMYQGKRPFYLLDDPFAMLDDENVMKAAELLRKVAGGSQIVYFTCAQSRLVE